MSGTFNGGFATRWMLLGTRSECTLVARGGRARLPPMRSTAPSFAWRMLPDGLGGADREDLPQVGVAEVLLEALGECA